MRTKILAILGLVTGLLLMIISGYFYFFSGKTIFSSEEIKINPPETSVTKTFQLAESGNPHKVTMDVDFSVTKNPNENELQLFTYGASIINSKNQVIEQKSTGYIHRINRGEDADDPTGNKRDTITLFSLNNIPSDTYAIAIVIKPVQKLDSVILNGFSYKVKSNVIPVHPILPIVGATVMLLSYIYLQFGTKIKQIHTEKEVSPQK